MSAPTVSPADRRLIDTPRTDQYASDARVWVFRAGVWRPGVVLSSSPEAAVVRYRAGETSATSVDTVRAQHLAHRADADPYVDQVPGPNGLVRRR